MSSQSQAVSDGGKSKKTPHTQRVCAWQKKTSDWVGFSVMLLSADNWVCLCLNVLKNWTCLRGDVEAAAPVFQGLRVERSARQTACSAGPCPSRSCWRTPAGSDTLRWMALTVLSLDYRGLFLCKCAVLVTSSVCPQSFLMSEVSAENILFYQACEKFKKILATSVDEVGWKHFLFVFRVFWTAWLSFFCHVVTVGLMLYFTLTKNIKDIHE